MQRQLKVGRFFLALGFFAVFMAACSQTAKTAGVGEAKQFSTACDKANDGKNVAVEGYLRFPESFTGSKDVVLRLYETSNFDGSPIGVQIDFGTQANQVKAVADQYSDSDLTVYLADGGPAQFGSKVKVSGYVYYPLVGQDFTCGLDTPYLESAE